MIIIAGLLFFAAVFAGFNYQSSPPGAEFSQSFVAATDILSQSAKVVGCIDVADRNTGDIPVMPDGFQSFERKWDDRPTASVLRETGNLPERAGSKTDFSVKNCNVYDDYLQKNPFSNKYDNSTIPAFKGLGTNTKARAQI